jgi:N-acetylneuraminic acid mutarotase
MEEFAMPSHYRFWACAAGPLVLLATVGCQDDSRSPTEPGAGSLATPQLALGSNTWVARKDMPSDRNDFALATVPNASGQSILYVMGGHSPGGGGVSQVNAYNVATNTWTWRAQMPVPVFKSNGAGVIGGKIYVSGGAVNFYNYSAALQVYDPAKNVWIRKRDLPAAGAFGLTGVIDGKLYVLTGCGGTPCFFFRYDPASDHWTSLPTPIQPHVDGVGGVIGNKLYVVGGGAWGDGTTLEAYDPATNQWTAKGRIPERRYSSASVVMGNRLHVIGGSVDGPDGVIRQTRTHLAYDPAKNIWITKAPLPSSAHALAVAGKVFLNGLPRIEFVGGSRPGNNWQYIQ